MVGRATCLQLENDDYHYVIINVYGAPHETNEEHTAFCKKVFSFTETYAEGWDLFKKDINNLPKEISTKLRQKSNQEK